MNDKQRSAIRSQQDQLVSDLEKSAEILMDCLESKKVISSGNRDSLKNEKTEKKKLINLLGLVQGKDNGWDTFITYLYENDHGQMAAKLKQLAGEPVDSNGTGMTPMTTQLDVFSLKLAEYYQQNSKLWSLYRKAKLVQNVWIPHQITEDSERGTGETFSHEVMLKRQKESPEDSVALIRADPGGGKTALMKKICHSWAVKRLANQLTSDDFAVVLLVPLRSAGECEDLLQMAVSYFLKIFRLAELDVSQLITQLTNLATNLLLCLDGLEEYRYFDNSPLSSLFARPFDQSVTNTFDPLPYIPYKLLVTARPYACETNNVDFQPLQFVVCSLDDSQVGEFVDRYCETDEGKTRVKRHLENSAIGLKIPLLLTFMCYLADIDEEIPTNQTLLYDRCLYQMLKREAKGEKLAEKVNLEKGTAGSWRETVVVRSTADLAFHGCEEEKFVFRAEDLELHQVPNDAFVCGYLHQEVDFNLDCWNAEFPHMSVQEYLAALRYYQLAMRGEIPEKTEVIGEMSRKYSLFLRFLLGIASTNGNFQELVDRITQPHICSTISLANYFVLLSDDRVTGDCKSAEPMISKQKMELILNDSWGRETKDLFSGNFSDLSSLIFVSGATVKDPPGLFWVNPNKPRRAEFGDIFGLPSPEVSGKIDSVDVLNCFIDGIQLEEMIARLRLLPPRVWNFRLEITGRKTFDIRLFFQYNNETFGGLRFFIFSFPKGEVPPIREFSVDTNLITKVEVRTAEDSYLMAYVKVSHSVPLPTLIKSAIPLALELYKSQPAEAVTSPTTPLPCVSSDRAPLASTPTNSVLNFIEMISSSKDEFRNMLPGLWRQLFSLQNDPLTTVEAAQQLEFLELD